MSINILKLSIFLIAFALTACTSLLPVDTKIDTDTWSGTYRMEPLVLDNVKANAENMKKIRSANMRMTRLADAVAKDLPERYRSDLRRWVMKPDNGDPGGNVFRRFVLNERDEYKEFGLQEMYISKKIECLTDEILTLCKTSPNTAIPFGENSLVTKSGIFGILVMNIHSIGFIEFYKLDSK
jgi:hypothetical protein